MVPVCASLLSALLFALPEATFADNPPVSPTELASHEKGFGTLQESTHTFSADILQSLWLQGLSKPLISKGVLNYASPNCLLIRFSLPEGEWMLVNGTQIAVQKQGKPLDLRDTSGQSRTGSHAASLLDFFRSGPEHWHRDFDVSMTHDGDRLQVHLKPWMTPTATFQGVDQIVTTLQLPGYELVSMEITMDGANRIRYDFSNVKRNLPLATSLFALPKSATP